MRNIYLFNYKKDVVKLEIEIVISEIVFGIDKGQPCEGFQK
jgi:hypothetical protein